MAPRQHVVEPHLHHHDAPAPDTVYVYVDRPVRRSWAAELGWMLLGVVLRFTLKVALVVVLAVGSVIGGLWLLGKGVEHLPTTGTTSTTVPR